MCCSWVVGGVSECICIVALGTGVGIPSGLAKVLTGVARFGNETFGAHRIRVVELISWDSNASELEYRVVVERFRSTEDNGTVSGADSSPRSRLDDPVIII